MLWFPAVLVLGFTVAAAVTHNRSSVHWLHFVTNCSLVLISAYLLALACAPKRRPLLQLFPAMLGTAGAVLFGFVALVVKAAYTVSERERLLQHVTDYPAVDVLVHITPWLSLLYAMYATRVPLRRALHSRGSSWGWLLLDYVAVPWGFALYALTPWLHCAYMDGRLWEAVGTAVAAYWVTVTAIVELL